MRLLLNNKWEIIDRIPLDSSVSLLDFVLTARNIVSKAEKEEFLSPVFSIVHDPFLMPDMRKACDTIIDAIQKKQKIIIYGDYDVDGITSTSTLVRFFRTIKVDFDVVIPDRILEGYGLNDSGIKRILDLGAELVITVDCGISSVREVEILSEKGIRVIITDHHECKPTLPDATAILNPKRLDNIYPFRDLAGVGVVFKLVQALCICTESGDSWKSCIDLAALGTIADIMPLYGENRMIVFHGLREINRSPNLGINSLLIEMDKDNKEVTESVIGYGIAPRINAAGRMGDSIRAVRLLTTLDKMESIVLAKDLIQDNKNRQDIELEIFEAAKDKIAAKFNPASNEIIVVYEKGWHQGVIGIVASRLVEIYHRSVIVFGGEEGYYKGSARSANNDSILEAIEFAGAFVHQYGGHKKAAGLVVNDTQMTDFLQAIRDYSALKPGDSFESDTIMIDFELSYRWICLQNALDLQQLTPHGEGNPQPIFMCRNLKIVQLRFLSAGRHMKLKLSGGNSQISNLDTANRNILNSMDAIAFGFSEKNNEFAVGDQVDVVFTMEINDWNNTKTVQINIKDIRRTPDENAFTFDEMEDLYHKDRAAALNRIRYSIASLNDYVPQKADFIAVFQYLKANFPEEVILCDLDILSRKISNNYKISITVFKLARIFDIFMETGVVHVQTIGRYRIKFQILEVPVKVSLSGSKTFQSLCTESVM